MADGIWPGPWFDFTELRFFSKDTLIMTIWTVTKFVDKGNIRVESRGLTAQLS